jgi:CAI-1 autoinducer synthase
MVSADLQQEVHTSVTTPLRVGDQPELPDFLRNRLQSFYEKQFQLRWGGRHILKGRACNHSDLFLGSNDYLAISGHPEILEACVEAFRQSENRLMMSAVFLQDESDSYHRLIRNLADGIGAQDGVLCQSGYAANVGLLQTIADPDTHVYIDVLGHGSLWEGIKSAGAKPVRIRHNDAGHLEQQVRRYGPGIIAVDAIYSTNGSVCPLKDFADVARNYGCVLIVDESHSLGTHGERGEGLVASLGLADRVHFRTASLAKAYVSRAGFIACSSEFRTYFEVQSWPAIFSSSLLAHDIAGIEAAHRLIQREDWRRVRLREITQYIRMGLEQLRFNISNGTEQIIGLEVGSEKETRSVCDELENRGVFGAIFSAPATSLNRSLIRLSLHAGLTDSQLDRMLAAFAEIRKEVSVDRWISSRDALRMERGELAPPSLV